MFFTSLISEVSFYDVFLRYLIKKYSFRTMFLSKVVILYEFLKVTFQKARVFSSGEPRGTSRSTVNAQTVVYYIEVRTLNARRMFREQLYSNSRRRFQLHSQSNVTRETQISIYESMLGLPNPKTVQLKRLQQTLK